MVPEFLQVTTAHELLFGLDSFARPLVCEGAGAQTPGISEESKHLGSLICHLRRVYRLQCPAVSVSQSAGAESHSTSTKNRGRGAHEK
jgi:hypothetical protein